MTWKHVCSWCGDRMRGPEDADHVSHGICSTCSDRVLLESLGPQVATPLGAGTLLDVNGPFAEVLVDGVGPRTLWVKEVLG